MTTIFDEIKPNENLNFGELNSSDLAYLLNLVNQYKLSLRERLGVSIGETIGLELECDNANWEQIREGKLDGWTLIRDRSLKKGAELISPILHDTKEDWQHLRQMCDVLSKHSEISEDCGSHVHIGIQALAGRKDALRNFLTLWAVYEPILFRFGYGEFLGNRLMLEIFGKSMSYEFTELCLFAKAQGLSENEMLIFLTDEKYNAVNFKHWNDYKTVEFRCPNGTLNPVVWQNNANVFMKMLLYSSSDSFNKGLLEEMMRRYTSASFLDSEVHTDYAIEFADLVFDNNVDKIYFLRQYLKNFEKGGQYVKAKPFTNPFGTLS